MSLWGEEGAPGGAGVEEGGARRQVSYHESHDVGGWGGGVLVLVAEGGGAVIDFLVVDDGVDVVEVLAPGNGVGAGLGLVSKGAAAEVVTRA